MHILYDPRESFSILFLKVCTKDNRLTQKKVIILFRVTE